MKCNIYSKFKRIAGTDLVLIELDVKKGTFLKLIALFT